MKRQKESIKEKVQSQLDVIVDTNSDEEGKEEKALNLSHVEIVDEKTIIIENVTYHVVENYRDAVNAEGIAKRYNTILNKYDYIVGDWGYDQLRLKGFYQDKNNRATFDKKISFLQDYLYEYCNFGCAYFVLEKEVSERKKTRSKRKRRRSKEPADNPTPDNKVKKTTLKDTDKTQQKKDFVIKSTDKTKQFDKKTKGKPIRKVDTPKTSFQIRKLED